MMWEREVLDNPETVRAQCILHGRGIVHQDIEISVCPERRIWIASSDLWSFEKQHRSIHHIAHPPQKRLNGQLSQRRCALGHVELGGDGSALGTQVTCCQKVKTVRL